MGGSLLGCGWRWSSRVSPELVRVHSRHCTLVCRLRNCTPVCNDHVMQIEPRALGVGDTRERILDVAIEVLGKSPDAGMGEVATAAGVVRRTVYGYFPSRSDLVLALTERAVNEIATVLAEAATVDDAADAVWADFVARLWPLVHRYRVLVVLRRGEFGEDIHALLGPVETGARRSGPTRPGQWGLRSASPRGASQPGGLVGGVRHRRQRSVPRHPRRPCADDDEPAHARSCRTARAGVGREPILINVHRSRHQLGSVHVRVS